MAEEPALSLPMSFCKHNEHFLMRWGVWDSVGGARLSEAGGVGISTVQL